MWPPKIQGWERSCVNCKWFTFADRRDNFGNPVKLNRECTYPGPVKVKNGVCQMWKDTRTLAQKLKGERVKKGFC